MVRAFGLSPESSSVRPSRSWAATRTTTTFPIGAMGNDRPIVVVNESWFSPELKVQVLQKNSDPRSGESTTRLTNISRAEPDASLFQVPADYEIMEPQSAVGGIKH